MVDQRRGCPLFFRSTLWKAEAGNPAVAMGIYAAVLHALNNMDKDLLLVAKDDVMGKKMQDFIPGNGIQPGSRLIQQIEFCVMR